MVNRYSTRLAERESGGTRGNAVTSESKPYPRHLTTVAISIDIATMASARAYVTFTLEAAAAAIIINTQATCQRPECGRYANGGASVR